MILPHGHNYVGFDINDAIRTAYTKNERTQEVFNVLNTNQRTLKRFLLSKTNVTDGRIFFKYKLFVPNVHHSKFRFIQKFHDDLTARHPNKTKTYEIFNRYDYWPKIMNDVKLFVRNCYDCKKNKKNRDRYHGALKILPIPNKR